jgi:hypothetical protein
MPSWVSTFVLVALVPATAVAQGNLSTHGLGFPPGQLSASARVMGGASGEADGLSALNPAAISMLSTAVVLIQSEPEFRTVDANGASQTSSTARFPLFFGALPLGSRWTASLSASTLLDRTWATISRDSQVVGDDTLASTHSRSSDGSIADVRVAVAFATTPWLRLGLGVHKYSGRTVLQSVRAFDDTVLFAPDSLASSISFSGAALSVGAQAFWPRVAAIGVTYRRGGTLRKYAGDVPVDAADAPGHIGVSAVYLGIRGTQIAARVAMDDWSVMRGLGDSLHIHEGLDIGVGADVRGPVLAGSPISLRAGFRTRTLPFSLDENAINERSVSGGVGLPMAGNRVELNLGAILSSRSRDAGGASERAWTFSTGFIVRP